MNEKGTFDISYFPRNDIQQQMIFSEKVRSAYERLFITQGLYSIKPQGNIVYRLCKIASETTVTIQNEHALFVT